MTHDPPQDIFQILLGIDVQVPVGLDQRQDRGAGLAAFFAADEQPVLATDSQGPTRPFGDIVVQPGVRVGQLVFKVRR